MGIPKGLLKYKESYWILEQIKLFKVDKTTRTTSTSVFIGLGYDFQQYFNEIPWLEKAVKKSQIFKEIRVRVVVNKQPQLGFFSTLQTVLKEVNKTTKNIDVLILPIDVPLLQVSELQKILKKKAPVVIPVYQQKKGHPVFISSKIWKSFLTVSVNDKNTRLDKKIQQLSSDKIDLVDVLDKNVTLNLNTFNDWQKFNKTVN